MLKRFLPLCLACSLAFFGGCAVGPDYARPVTVRPNIYKEAPEAHPDAVDWRPATPGVPDPDPWWEAFADPLLNTMMEELGTANQNIQAALANLRQARAQVREARASFFPVLGGSGSYTRGNTALNKSTVSNTYTAGLQASWEPDIWGGTRRSVEGSEAQAEAQAAQLGAVLLSMRGELALNYFQLRTFDAMIGMYAQTVAAYTRSLAITENRYKGGTATRADVATALAQLRAAQAAAVDLERQRQQTEHAMANLLGKAPAEFTLAPARLQAHLPSIETGLPASLVERRPDVAAAERQVAAANAAIGVAKSAYFPIFTFPVSGGYSGSSFHQWFIPANEIWSLGPALAMTIFQGGALVAKTDQAVAAWESAVAAYRQTVLQAFNDVEDALVAARLLQDEEKLQQEALLASRDAEQMLLVQFKEGTVTFIDVATAQATSLANARAVEQVRGARFAAAVTLVRALGGGWDAKQLTAKGDGLPDAAQQDPGQ